MLEFARLRAGHVIAPGRCLYRRGKSELHTGGMPGNARSRRREGKCHRKHTAFRTPRAPDGKGEKVR